MIYEVKTVRLKDPIVENDPKTLQFLEEGWEPFSVTILESASTFRALLYLRRLKNEPKEKVLEVTSWEL